MKLRGGVAGNTLVYRFPIMTIDGDPLDLTNYEIAFTIKRSTQDTDSAATCQLLLTPHISGQGITFPYTPGDGIVDVTIPSAVTASMRIRRPYFYDLTIIDTNDLVTTVFHGTISVLAPVSSYVSVDS
jgi:hypothetical protein